MRTQFTFISTPSHGYLLTNLEEILLLGIEQQISGCSYFHTIQGTCFLEEDCDATVFLDAVESVLGKKPDIKKLYDEDFDLEDEIFAPITAIPQDWWDAQRETRLD